VAFINRGEAPVELCWMDRSGHSKPYGLIAAGKTRHQQTRPGAVWLIKTEAGRVRGYFSVGDRTARAVIPAP
jgi:hypothetical protein